MLAATPRPPRRTSALAGLSYSPEASKLCDPLSVHLPAQGRSTQQRIGATVCLGRRMPDDVFHATRLPFDPGSPFGVLRGGALEPESRRAAGKNCTLKRTQVFQRVFQRDARGVFLSQAGPRFDLNLFKLSITSVSVVGAASETTKATRWIALDWLVMRLGD